MTKKILYLLIFASLTSATFAQSYQNEWIDYSKTYYKFKVGPFGRDIVYAPIKKGIVRITQPTLAAAGLGNVPSEQFQLWRDGAEVPIYISTPSGILSPTDYIEFWGEMANGKPDKQLYSDSSFQLSDYWSLESDSAAYFLTVNSSGNNKRFVTVGNNVSGTTLSAEKNFMYKVGRYFMGYIDNGFGVYVEQKLYLSQYDRGEGFSSRPIGRSTGDYLQSFPNLYADTSGAAMTASYSLVGNAPYPRQIKLQLFTDSLAQFSLDYFDSKQEVVSNIAANRLKNDDADLYIRNLYTDPSDEMRVEKIELTYPRRFNFGNSAGFEFYIDSASQGRYLKIANFNKGTGTAILYDFTNGTRYIADTTVKDTLRFVLQPSIQKYHLVLVRSDGSAGKTINSLQSRQYIDFTQQANQGNYLIITNPVLYGSGPTNYIQQYSDYRSSDSGGHFNVKIVDIHQLEDQFAYGIGMHPLSIKNFLRFARNNFATPPSYAFLIGKGISYPGIRDHIDYGWGRDTVALTQQLNLLPVWGYPGSDNLLSSDDYTDIPATPISRLSVVTPAEVGVYFQKIKEYEAAQRDTSSSIEERLWQKQVLQLAGANDTTISFLIDSFQTNYKNIIGDTLFGGDVRTFSKTSDPSKYAESLVEFTDLYNQGSALLEYLGHSSSTSIDFSLDNPSNYTNVGKYPVFIVNGCLAGNIFDYDLNRLNNRSTLSEKFVLEPERGSIGYLSSSSFGVLNYLDIFTEEFYKSIAYRQYANGFANIIKDGITNALNYTGTDDFYARMHAEQFTFQGDPALKMNYFTLPDYATDSAHISVSPGYLTVASGTFNVKIKVYNLGKTVNDSVHFSLIRKYPRGGEDTVFSRNLAPINSIDSLTLTLPIVANRDKGTTTLVAIVDDKNLIPELHENNNSGSIDVQISAADLLPISPYNYSIVDTSSVDLSASTAYAFDSLTQYVMELDTTALFNSTVKISMQQVSTGGLVTFPDVPLSSNNTVYYWRVSEDSANKHWSSFSFIYRDGGNKGFEQAHFYQHTQSLFDGLILDSSTRAFNFSKAYSNLFIQHAIFPTSGNEDADFSISENGTFVTYGACVPYSIIFNVFDPKTLKPVLDSTRPYGAGGPNCDSMKRYNYEYDTRFASTRKNAMDFLDNYVQNGYYVVARKVYDSYYGGWETDWAPTVWAADTALYGHNNSLYHRLKAQGVAIDSFILPRTFIFIFKKNDSANYKSVSVLSKGMYDKISTSQNMSISDSEGTVTSPLFGPGKAWNKVTWYGKAENHNNLSSLDVVSVDKNGKDSVWYNIDTSQHELNISSINATNYPYIKLRMHSKDGATVRPYQLQDWSIEFTPVPEGAISTNLGFDLPDTLNFNHAIHISFDTMRGYVVFKNISNTPFDSLKVKLVMYDSNNVAYTYTLPRTRTLPAGDTLHVSFLVNVTDLPQGMYNLYLEVNPDDDQPEQYHYNNFLYHYVYINRESALPVHLLSFTAKPINNSALLEWTVVNELNVANYSVEFSRDGRNFTVVGDVPAANFHANEKSYSFIHTGTVNGKNYYRIKMIDLDGKYEYSPVRMLIIGNINVRVYPNPFHDQLNIVNSNSGTAIVRVLDLTGKQLLQQTFTTSTMLNINHIASGVYIVQINDGVNIQSFKVFKQ